MVDSHDLLRKALLAKVHIAKVRLGLSEDEYRNLLEDRFDVASARELSTSRLESLLEHFGRLGWRPEPGLRRRSRTTPHAPKKRPDDRSALLSKIEALLADKGAGQARYVPRNYAAAILKRMYGVERLEWARPEHLRGVIAALSRDGRRRRAAESEEPRRGV